MRRILAKNFKCINFTSDLLFEISVGIRKETWCFALFGVWREKREEKVLETRGCVINERRTGQDADLENWGYCRSKTNLNLGGSSDIYASGPKPPLQANRRMRKCKAAFHACF